MSILRTTRFTVDPSTVDAFLDRRAALIDAVRSAYPGLAHTLLGRVDDQTWTDSWVWESADHMRAAVSGAGDLPEAAVAFELVSGVEAEQAEVVALG